MEQNALLCPGHGALAQRAAAYSAEGYNCAESVLLASIDQYHLPLTADAARLVSGFGGGVGCGDFCGALAGGVAALSYMTCKTKAHDQPEVTALSAKLLQRFQQKLGDTLCTPLKEKYRQPGVGCRETICLGADALQALVQEEGLVPAEA